MSDYSAMSLVLSVLLVLSALLRLLRRTLCRSRGGAALPAAVTLLGGGLLLALAAAVIIRFTGPHMLLPALLLLVLFLTGAAALEGLSRMRGKGMFLAASLLAAWLLGVAVITVMMRRSGDTQVLLRFDALGAAMRKQSFEPLVDPLENLLLFLPLGLLLPRADAEPHARWMNVLSTALLLTAAIEGAQLLFRLGQADVEDLAANVLGALAGFALQHILPRSASHS